MVPDNSIKWLGTNFSEVYEWLTNDLSFTDFKLKILEPGSSKSTIEIKVNNISLSLRVGDTIVRDGIFYFVVNV